MDIQSAAAMLVNYLGSDPDKIAQFAQHPYSTTAKVTGTDERISQKDMSRILTQVAAQETGQNLGTDATKSLASTLMGQSGGSVHALANALFGGTASAAKPSASVGGADIGSMLGALMGGSSASQSPSAGPSMAEIAAKSVAGGLAARGLAALITSAMNANKNTPSKKALGHQG